MRLSLDVRRARKGDCLLLHFGDANNPGVIMIDGGPSSVYGPFLKPRLKQIKKARKLGETESLPIDLLMVSHVDDDHIKGILDLTREELDAKLAKKPLLVNVLDFWHNSFDAVISHNSKELLASFAGQFGAAATSGAELSDDAIAEVEDESNEDEETIRSTLQVLASIEQGFRLRQDVEGLEFPLNTDFKGDLIVARATTKPIKIGKQLSLTVAGPMIEDVNELRKKHVAWLQALKKAGKKPPAALAAYVDKSVPNLSSLVVLAESGKKRILLTGDARGDKILEGLELVGALEKGGTMEVEILKVPHHGSSNNLAKSFFERIVAKHYVFSGDGEHGNPERESMEMLFAARKKEPFTIHLTYPIDEIDVERKKDWEKEQAKQKARKKKNPKVKVRPNWSADTQSLASFFAKTKLAPGQQVSIVDAKAPHVIDLLDPLGF